MAQVETINWGTSSLVIPYSVLAKVMYIIKHVPGEVGGLGDVIVYEGFTFLNDVFLFEQVANSGECELEAQAIMELMEERVNRGEDISNMICWWHSHGSGKTFFSGTDRDTIQKVWPGDNLVALVGNKKEEWTCAFYGKKPFPHLAEMEVEYCADELDVDALKKEISEKVHPAKVVVPGKSFQGDRDWQREYARRNGYGYAYGQQQFGWGPKNWDREEDDRRDKRKWDAQGRVWNDKTKRWEWPAEYDEAFNYGYGPARRDIDNSKLAKYEQGGNVRDIKEGELDKTSKNHDSSRAKKIASEDIPTPLGITIDEWGIVTDGNGGYIGKVRVVEEDDDLPAYLSEKILDIYEHCTFRDKCDELCLEGKFTACPLSMFVNLGEVNG